MTERKMGSLRTANTKHNRAIVFATRTAKAAKAPTPDKKTKTA